jgi:hypothetical protein
MVKVSKKSGKESYYMQALGACIVHPDRKEVIPLCPEMIQKQDGDNKNDCERNAARRFFEKLKKEHPFLKLMIIEDALSPNAPHIRDIKAHGHHFILGVKPGDHEFLFAYVDQADSDGKCDKFSMKDEKDPEIEHRFRFINDVPLNKSNQDFWTLDKHIL